MSVKGFTLVKGTFQVVGYEPDGDTLRFKAINDANWAKLEGPAIKKNARGDVSLRFEAIDALETHFEGRHQPQALAFGAQQFLLEAAGIRNVEFDATHTKVTSADDNTPGYILAREVEVNRRAVAFVFAGDAPEEDGKRVHVDESRVQQSLNYALIKNGLVFPTYYQGLFSDLRQVFTDASQQARGAKLGVWKVDETNSGVDVQGLHTVTDEVVILPKLFRRLVAYLENGGTGAGFKQFLAASPDPVIRLSDGHFTNLDTFIAENGAAIRLTEPIENLVFDPKKSG